MDLKLGDTIVVTNQNASGWWQGYWKGAGSRQAKTFPGSYVKIIQDVRPN